jgi:hypothetical protein
MRATTLAGLKLEENLAHSQPAALADTEFIGFSAGSDQARCIACGVFRVRSPPVVC